MDWFFNCAKVYSNSIWFVVFDSMYVITGYVICCAKCHFLSFLPFSSITMPRYCKMLPVTKTPENSTFPLFHMKMRYSSHNHASKSYSTIVEWIFSNCINRTNTVNTRVHITHYALFGKHHLLLLVNLIYYHLPHYPYYANYYTIL